MINLLSTDYKSEVRAARVNVFLVRYITILILAVVFIVGVLYASYIILLQTESSAQERIDLNTAKAQDYSDTKSQVDELSARLADAQGVLAQDTSYATILTTIGQVMPVGTVLGELTLSEATFGAPIDLIAYAQSDAEAVSIQQQLQTSPLFGSVTPKGTGSADGIEGYPVKVTLTVMLNKANF